MNKQSKQLILESIGLFIAGYGVAWGFAEAALALHIFPESVEKLGITGYLILLIPGVVLVLGNIILKKYINPDLTPVTICQFHRSINYLPLYIAEKNGYFRSEGLDVKIIDGYGDDITWEKVKSSEADFGVADPLMMLTEQNVKGKVVASIVDRAIMYGLTKKSILQMKNANDFVGKTVAVYKSPSTSFMMMQCVINNNQLKGKVNIKEMLVTSEFSLLDDTKVDIVFMPEPMATIAEHKGAYRVWSMAEYFGDFLLSGLFTTDKYIKEHPETVQKVVNAIERSLHFVHDFPLEAVKVATREFAEQEKLPSAKATISLFIDKSVPDCAAVRPVSWNNCLRVRRPKDSSKFSFSEFVDNSFALKAAEKYKNKD